MAALSMSCFQHEFAVRKYLKSINIFFPAYLSKPPGILCKILVYCVRAASTCPFVKSRERTEHSCPSAGGAATLNVACK